jgi:hypothetical protein
MRQKLFSHCRKITEKLIHFQNGKMSTTRMRKTLFDSQSTYADVQMNVGAPDTEQLRKTATIMLAASQQRLVGQANFLALLF